MSDELLSIFWVEVSEHLETLNNGLLQVEMLSPDDKNTYKEAIRELNRVAHSMKGAARAVGFGGIETISHYMEEVFGAIMAGKLTLTPEVADAMYDGVDLIQKASNGEETNEEAMSLVLKAMEGIVAQTGEPAGSESEHTNGTSKLPDSSSALPNMRADSQTMAAVIAENGNQMGEVLPHEQVTEPPEPEPSPPPATLETTTTTNRVSEFDGGTMVIRPVEETIRVTVSKLDRLMAEVTELFVARMHNEEQERSIRKLRRSVSRWQRDWRNVRAAYIRLVRRLQDEAEEENAELQTLFRFLELNQRNLTDINRQLAQLSQNAAQDNLRLTTLADLLQDDIGGMRLMPFESIIGGFQRMVRDLARDTGKQVHLEIVGGAVEIDKAVLDSLKDPLMHVLRNSVDHGIETPDVREANGKPPMGHVILEIQQRGSEINIYVRDDGRGIDANRVRKAIVKNGLLNEAEAAALSEDEARTYIFYSGLSTSDKVTALSGRGMGMDIVRDRVESLRGRVSVQSTVGQGTLITLSVPVSLTRLRCIILRVGDQQFAVPSVMVVRMDSIPRNEIFTVEGRETISISEKPVPIASMGAILDIPADGHSDEAFDFVALQAIDRVVAFEVDELITEQELVLKPLGQELARSRFVSGASLLGTGEVIVVLDANDLVRRAIGAALPRRRTAVTTAMARERKMCVLVVDDSITTRTLEKNILETAGFDVYVAMDGQEAWGMLPQADFDVIISDVEMPNMTGLELTARIKSSAQYQDIPVILLTSLGKPEQREAGLRAGANAYLVKSRFDQGELLQTIMSVV